MVTDVESGISLPEMVMLVMRNVRTWYGVPTRMDSFLKQFSCKKVCFNHAFIFYRQIVKVEDGRAAEEVSSA